MLRNSSSKVFHKTKSEDFIILACVVLTQCHSVTSRRIDKQMDRYLCQSICIASYADTM